MNEKKNKIHRLKILKNAQILLFSFKKKWYGYNKRGKKTFCKNIEKYTGHLTNSYFLRLKVSDLVSQ